MNLPIHNSPWGVQCIERALSKYFPQLYYNRMKLHQIGVFFLTFIAYTCYHMTRKPLSVVKNVLNLNCSTLIPPSDIIINDTNKDTWCDWAPFDTPDASTLFGTLDFAFLIAYAVAMFFSGFIAERVDLRYFLTLGMLGSAISCYAFGLARPYNIHNFWYFIFVQVIGGIFQTSGAPAVVAVLGNWYGKGQRGLIFGVWSSHSSVGNIVGTIIATKYLQPEWGLSFMIPGALMGLVAVIMFAFLVPNPTDVGCTPPSPLRYRRLEPTNSSDESSDIENHVDPINDNKEVESETSPMLSRHTNSFERDNAIGFFQAIKIPGVIEYSLSLFFAKLVSYTFLYWLPIYIAATTNYGAILSSYVSTLFDVGGILGGIVGGVYSDYSGMSALTCASMLGIAVPTMFIYDYLQHPRLWVNIVLLLIGGFMVNGPYTLITTVVAADLGTHRSLEHNSKALATVAAIIDGTGSIGAAIGPLLAGVISRLFDWHSVIYMLMIADLLALMLLSRLVYRDIRLYIQRRRNWT